MAGLADWNAPRGGWRRWGWTAASVVFHAGLLAALVMATEDEAVHAAESPEEEITYVDISSFPPPPPPPAAAAEPEPQPQQTQPEPQQPRPVQQPPPRPQTPPRPTDILEPEPPDSLPDPLGETPPIQPIPAPVTQGPPSGQVTAGSQAGGQEGGVEGGVEGGRVGGEVGATGPPAGGTYVEAVVDRKAELRNRRELPRIMERLYPAALRDAGVGGRVVVQFVVDENGRVDMGSVKITSSEHDGLEEPTRRALREFRFTPARMGDRTVRMLTQMPIVWQVARI